MVRRQVAKWQDGDRFLWRDPATAGAIPLCAVYRAEKEQSDRDSSANHNDINPSVFFLSLAAGIASAVSVRLIPSGVISSVQARTSATGRP